MLGETIDQTFQYVKNMFKYICKEYGENNKGDLGKSFNVAIVHITSTMVNNHRVILSDSSHKDCAHMRG